MKPGSNGEIILGPTEPQLAVDALVWARDVESAARISTYLADELDPRAMLERILNVFNSGMRRNTGDPEIRKVSYIGNRVALSGMLAMQSESAIRLMASAPNRRRPFRQLSDQQRLIARRCLFAVQEYDEWRRQGRVSE